MKNKFAEEKTNLERAKSEHSRIERELDDLKRQIKNNENSIKHAEREKTKEEGNLQKLDQKIHQL